MSDVAKVFIYLDLWRFVTGRNEIISLNKYRLIDVTVGTFSFEERLLAGSNWDSGSQS